MSEPKITISDTMHGHLPCVLVVAEWDDCIHGVSVPTAVRGREVAIADAAMALQDWRREKTAANEVDRELAFWARAKEEAARVS